MGFSITPPPEDLRGATASQKERRAKRRSACGRVSQEPTSKEAREAKEREALIDMRFAYRYGTYDDHAEWRLDRFMRSRGLRRI